MQEEIDRLLQHTFLQDSARFVTSTENSSSFDALLTHLRSKADDYQRQQQQRPFRLAIDRTFSVKGSGVVITGTAHSGCVSIDEHYTISPQANLCGSVAYALRIKKAAKPERRALRTQHQRFGIGATATWRLVERNATCWLSNAVTGLYRSAKTSRAALNIGRQSTSIMLPTTVRPDWHWRRANI